MQPGGMLISNCLIGMGPIGGCLIACEVRGAACEVQMPMDGPCMLESVRLGMSVAHSPLTPGPMALTLS